MPDHIYSERTIRAVANPLDPETLRPYRCSGCGDLIDHPVAVHFKGRTNHFHLACLCDTAAVMTLLLARVPCATPL